MDGRTDVLAAERLEHAPPGSGRNRAMRAYAGPLLLMTGALAFFLAFGLRYFGPIDDPHFGERLAVLRVHIAAGAVALFLGPLQFVRAIRARRPAVHRLMGRVYLATILVSALAGLWLAPFANGGLPGSTGFAALSVVWLATSAMALTAIRRGRIREHREWMIRSYVVTLAFVWVRLILGTGLVLGADIQAVFGVAAWACWAVPLLVVELVFGAKRLRTAP